MKIEQKKWTAKDGWHTFSVTPLPGTPQIVFVFSSSALAADSKNFEEVKAMYPDSHILQCSTAGEIINSEVLDDSLSVTAIQFEKTTLQFGEADITNSDDSLEVGRGLAGKISKENLIHVMIFSDGLKVNGTALLRGVLETLPKEIAITGGLVGDADKFQHTYIGLDKAPTEGKIVIIGFYGENLKIGYGSLGGWDPFGPERVITKSKNNVLYELDNKPALALYKEYLGAKAEGLPGTGLLFPLSLRIKDDNGRELDVVRTLLAVNETEQSMTFAGNMPEGTPAKLMQANFDRLIDGASEAANRSKVSLAGSNPELAILISCVGRKLVLNERIEEEIEAVRSIFGTDTAITGFYSYGELCPGAPTEKQCQLHNQTMTITTLREE